MYHVLKMTIGEMQMNLSAIPVVKLPLVNVSTDPLDLTTVGMVLRMKQLAKTSPKFIELVHDRQLKIQICAENGMARQIIINKDKVDSEPGLNKDADFTLIFKDSDYGVKTLLKGDPSAFIAGIKDGSIKIDGDQSILVWFSKLMRLLPPKLPKNVERQFKQAKLFVRKKLGK